jgi:hypothetical protein
MLEAIIAFGVMAGVAAALALSTGHAVALLTWLTISAIACSLAALAMQSQPLGESTPMGRVGGLLVRWGFEVGQGQLFPALAISWFIWALLGAAVISLISFRSDRPLATMILVWAVDAFALIYLLGIALSPETSSLANSLLLVFASLAGMLIVSTYLWFHPHLFGGRRTAMLVAAGPPLLVGGGYVFFLLVMLVVGQFTRWN